jgi:hypothetical protein
VADDAAERSAATFSTWKGESKAADGVLKPRGEAARFINAASSPYTVVVRYFQEESQKKALLRIDSFWPRWTGTGDTRALVDDSLKFSWTLKDCPGGMQGQFQIFDKEGKIVWRQALTPTECGNGTHTHNWTEGKPLLEEAKMPYRVQIQVHTNKDTAPGLGLAGMHTEVRIFTHPEIGTHDKDHELEPQVLAFSVAPFYSFNGAAPPEDSAKGRKLRLAKAGYHPGPVEDGEGQTPYLRAVKEFQRDHAKPGVAPAERLKADGSLDALTKTAIASQAANRRPLFAQDSRTDMAADTDITSALNVKGTQIVVWVDDRHNHTDIPAQGLGALLPNMDLEQYHGGMSLTGDGKVAKDKSSICRPFLPVEAALPLMKKADKLQDPAPVVPEVTDSMRRATGPIRVDWTFRDLAPEYKVDTSKYTATRVRPLRFLTDVMTNNKGTHNDKDAFNCPVPLGGLRDGNYYQNPFGIETESLMPWKTLADGGVKTVCSVAHDDLGQDEARVYEPRLGKAGVYLQPSIIGGDGYQFRAQVSFRDLPSGSTHPNWKALRDRYDETKLPQAHTSPMRLWRKDSYRAHVRWAAGSNWGAYDGQAATFFEAGMVHLVQEGGGNDFRATQLFTGGLNAYKAIVTANVTGGMGNSKPNGYRDAAEITFTDNFVWPWSSARHLGVEGVPPPGTAPGNYAAVFRDQIFTDTWRAFRDPLAFTMLSEIERNHGLLRGHMIAEFDASPPLWIQQYFCDTCGTDQLLIETTSAGGSGVGEYCRVAVCGGKLEVSLIQKYKCNQCGFEKQAFPSAGMAGSLCTAQCTGTIQTSVSLSNLGGWMTSRWSNTEAVTTTYHCDNCSRTFTAVEAGNNRGSKVGTACGLPCPRHGQMTAVPPIGGPKIVPYAFRNLSLPSVGMGLGTLFLDTNEGPRTYWAHEVGHHKHLEHAGDVIQNPPQHDQAANTVDATVQRATDPKSRLWDRDCIMSYVNTESGPDAAYFCGKCLLKLRGWKVEGLANPAGNVSGP